MKEDGSNRYFIVNVFLFKLTFAKGEEFGEEIYFKEKDWASEVEKSKIWSEEIIFIAKI